MISCTENWSRELISNTDPSRETEHAFKVKENTSVRRDNLDPTPDDASYSCHFIGLSWTDVMNTSLYVRKTLNRTKNEWPRKDIREGQNF